MDLNEIWKTPFIACYDNSSNDGMGAASIQAKNPGKEKILNLDAIVAVAICLTTSKKGGTTHTRNSAAVTHASTISNPANTATSVQLEKDTSLSPPGRHMIGVHTLDVCNQARRNHITTIKLEALGGASANNPSGLPTSLFTTVNMTSHDGGNTAKHSVSCRMKSPMCRGLTTPHHPPSPLLARRLHSHMNCISHQGDVQHPL